MKHFNKMGKILSLLLALSMILSFMPTISFAEESTSVFKITVNADGTTCTVNGFTDEAKAKITADGYELTIPETIDGYTVTAIGDNAFRKSSEYMTYMPGVITMPDTIKSIGMNAFAYCKKMTIEKWPDSLEVIKQAAFNNAQNCTKVTGDFTNTKLRVIEKQAFTGAPGVLRINGVGAAKFPDTLTTVGDDAFTWLTMPTFVFPDSVTSIGKKALSTGYAGLREVHFPRNSVYTKISADVISSAYPTRTDRLSPPGSCLRLYIPETITTIEDSLLRDVGDDTTAIIYGKYGSAAWDFYNKVKKGLEDGTYTNAATYPHIEYKADGTTVNWKNPEDKDKDGKGEMASISFVAYDFDLGVATPLDDNGIFNGENTLPTTTGTGNENPAVKTSVGGLFGKAADDLAYKLEVTGESHTGFNFFESSGYTLKTTIFETAMARGVDYAGDIVITTSLYKTAKVADNITVDGESVSNRYSGSLIEFKSGGIYTGDNPAIKSEFKKKLILEAKPEQWVTVAVVVPGYETTGKGSSEIYVYINGECYTIGLEAEIFGTRHVRMAPSGKFTETQTVYYDNVRTYTADSEVYVQSKDAPAEVDFSGITAEGNEIIIPGRMSVSMFKNYIETNGNIRVYADSSCKTELSDSDAIAAGNVVVIATKNNRTTERVYTYYTLKEETFELIEESGIYNGSNKLSVSVGEGNNNPATVTTVGGVYGRASDDLSYRIDAKGGNTGRNYFGNNCSTLDTRVLEISFAHSKDSMDLCLSGAMYITNVASDNITVDGASVSNRASGTFLTITKDSIVTSSHPAYASGWSGKKLADIEAEKWVNLAIVIPGSKQVGGATDKIYIYVNGEEFEIPLKTPIYGTRHLRFSPAQELDTVKTVYLDNFRQYNGSTELYEKEKDALPVYDLSAVDYYETNINVSEGTTVKELKDKIFTTAEIRVFKDDSYSEVLDDEDVLGRGNVVVFAANNRRVNERAYSYFTVNMPLSVKKINITNGDGKNIKGTTSDIKNSGEKYYLDATIENKASETEATLLAMVASYNEDGLLIGMDSKPVTVAPGTNVFAADKKEVFFENVDLEIGGTLKAFLWMPETNEPMCDNFETTLSGKEEYHILAFSNSYGNDAFSYICQIGKAVDIDIYAVNMYRGGCTLARHYEHMRGSGTYEKRIEYTPKTTITTENVSFADGLDTPGYSWDYITMQSKSTEAYNFDFYYTDSKPYLTAIADYIKTNSPKSELLMYQTWTLDTDTAKTSGNTKNIVAGLEEDQIRPTLFGLLKNNYIRAADMIGNPNRIIPVGEAINYALEELDFPQFVLTADGKYDSSGASRGIYRDTTCHLATCGKLINAFTWYEYITGRDARENPYQLSDVSAEDMALIKEAAHYACTRPEYNPQ